MSYQVTDESPVRFDGVVYTAGQAVPGLTAEQAAPLLELGVVVEAKEKEKPSHK